MQTDTLQLRQQQVDRLLSLLRKESERCDCLDILGGETDQETTANARALINVAHYDDVVSWIKKYESVKGKTYEQVNRMNPHCEIPGTLLGAHATHEELVIWYDTIIKTSFANGTRYQPLPSHDEAWKSFWNVRQSLVEKKRYAELWIYSHKDTIPMSVDELAQAAEFGLWDDIPLRGKRLLFKQLPPREKKRIRDENRGTTWAMQETRNHFDKTYQHV